MNLNFYYRINWWNNFQVIQMVETSNLKSIETIIQISKPTPYREITSAEVVNNWSNVC